MRSSTASVTWTPQNGIPIHPIFNSVGAGVGDIVLFVTGTEDICGILSGTGSLEVDIV